MSRTFGQAPDLDSEFTEAWYNKGRALLNPGKDAEALRALDKLLSK